ncbi:MAG: bifunctional hydroxymethylpyrimidine kinase/phosphomethylpyrimidine kinase [Robiginitomaculum sp.]|nr:bifunctional hydroxymethylpyrimidine kinase/phosphomethylpyrimidine kinase [Robiginitomaculum sp.]MDQ7078696.1 bifunctional hydroxymethylpyrimidine kinase/phosphomethylpyrimidine kinase [Robiginitomaculum sp.]
MIIKTTHPPVRILAIAGSDSSGGAGVQADIKTISALGGYAMSAITAITAQNTQGVEAVQLTPPELVRAQVRAVLEDVGVDAIKIGMLGDAFIAASVADVLHDVTVPIILDPVMVATSGDALLEDDAIQIIRSRLIPMARLITPNIPEAEALSGQKITNINTQRAAAEALLSMGPKAVLIKGGHGEGDILVDFLLWKKGEAVLESKRIETTSTHGTGCTLASALAVFLAQSLSLTDAVQLARRYVRGAIKNAPGFGAGHGPLDHGWINTGERS